MINKNSKIIFLAGFLSVGFCLAEAASLAVFLHASDESIQISDRRGLPAEMIMTADELREKQVQRFILFDARDKESYEESHIEGALLPLSPGFYKQENLYKRGISRRTPNPDKALKASMKKYSTDTPVITYCNSGGCQASAVLALQIKRLGFKDVKAMEEGIQTWDQKGYPMETRRNES